MKSSISIPDISCIICHHKGNFIYDCVESIKKSEGVTYEIIVITSSDELASNGISGCRVFNSQGMPAEKRNIGFRLSTANYLAFFDDDVVINSDCLSQLYTSIKNNNARGMDFGKLYNMEHRNRFDEAGGFITTTGFIWSRAGQNDIDRGQFDGYERILAGKSASCIISSDTFFEVGGFDEDFGILGEETDLAWRVWLARYEVRFNSSAVGYHAFNTKFKPAKEYYTSKRVHYNGCKNYLTMLIKNLGDEHLWIVPLHALIWFAVSLAMLMCLKVQAALNILAALGKVMYSLPELWKKRKKIQESRKVDESHLWPIIYCKTPRGYYWRRVSRYVQLGLHG